MVGGRCYFQNVPGGLDTTVLQGVVTLGADRDRGAQGGQGPAQPRPALPGPPAPRGPMGGLSVAEGEEPGEAVAVTGGTCGGRFPGDPLRPGSSDLQAEPRYLVSDSPFVTGAIGLGHPGCRPSLLYDCVHGGGVSVCASVSLSPPSLSPPREPWLVRDSPMTDHPTRPQAPSASCCPSPSSSAPAWAAGRPRPSGLPSSTMARSS